jgi:hypothetical protein
LFRGSRAILSDSNKQVLLRRLRRAFAWGRLRISFGLRTFLGLLIVLGGIFGFLPSLGFWMIPVGLVLIALDVPPLRRWLRSWLHNGIRPRRHRQGKKRIEHNKDEK